jgi:hypothetical protein
VADLTAMKIDIHPWHREQPHNFRDLMSTKEQQSDPAPGKVIVLTSREYQIAQSIT